MDYDEYKQLFELDDNKENLYELANEIYFKAIKGREKQFIIELEDEMIEVQCGSHGYRYMLIKSNDLVVPPPKVFPDKK